MADSEHSGTCSTRYKSLHCEPILGGICRRSWRNPCTGRMSGTGPRSSVGTLLHTLGTLRLQGIERFLECTRGGGRILRGCFGRTHPCIHRHLGCTRDCRPSGNVFFSFCKSRLRPTGSNPHCASQLYPHLTLCSFFLHPSCNGAIGVNHLAATPTTTKLIKIITVF